MGFNRILTEKWQTIGLFGILIIGLTYLVRDHAFFWDTVQLASKHAHWYYGGDFKTFLLPQEIDSGHPPFFGMYLAACWKLFGKTLAVSHFTMLPFLLGILYLLYELGVYFGTPSRAIFLLLLVLIDPVFAGQSVLVSPDIVLVFAFLLGIYSIIYEKNWALGIATILLGMVSLRGMMVGFSLFLWRFLLDYSFKVESSKGIFSWIQNGLQLMLPFLPGGLVALAFLVYHYFRLGWIGYHPDSPWAGSFIGVNFIGFFKNIGILGWRLLDFGRCFLWLVIFIIIGYKGRYIESNSHHPTVFRTISFKKHTTNPLIQLLILLSILTLILTPSLLLHKSLLAHRYLLPIFLVISLLFYHYWANLKLSKKVKNGIYAIAFVGLATGNLWIYPKHIAQGWDATLAHLPYYKLRKKMIAFIDEEKIGFATIGTAFPNIGAFEHYDLNGRTEGFVKKDFEKNKYFLYSVVFNDLSDEELKTLETEWEVVQEYAAYRLNMVLYRKR